MSFMQVRGEGPTVGRASHFPEWGRSTLRTPSRALHLSPQSRGAALLGPTVETPHFKAPKLGRCTSRPQSGGAALQGPRVEALHFKPQEWGRYTSRPQSGAQLFKAAVNQVHHHRPSSSFIHKPSSSITITTNNWQIK